MTVRVDVPARPDFLGIVRVSTAAAVADMVDDLDTLEDVRLAVDELAAAVIDVACPDARLHLDLRRQGQGVMVTGDVDCTRAPTISDVGERLLAVTCRHHDVRHQAGRAVFTAELGVTGAEATR